MIRVSDYLFICLLMTAALVTNCGGDEAPGVAETQMISEDNGPTALPGLPGEATSGTNPVYPGVTYPTLYTPPDGEPLEAEVTITRSRENAEVFELCWHGDGWSHTEGVGIAFGDNLFAVARVDAGGLGVGVYRLEEGGLSGIWTNGGGIGTEVIGEVRGDPPVLSGWPDDATFAVSGSGPDGTDYQGFLQAKAWNGAVVLRWTIGEERIPGGALPVGDWLVAGFNQGSYGVSVYKKEDDLWRGWWYAEGNGDFGREVLSPYSE